MTLPTYFEDSEFSVIKVSFVNSHTCQAHAASRPPLRHVGPMRLVVALLLGVWLVSACPRSVCAQVESPNREYTIKAAFLYHFLSYVEWPADSSVDQSQPFVIAVYQDDPFGAVLDKLASTKNVGGRSIVIKRVASLDEANKCHILFVPRTVSEKDQKKLLDTIAGTHVLCVGESDGFVNQGGAAEFYVEGNNVRFAFNTDVVAEKQLKVSSKLLALAKIVTNG